VVTPAEQMTAQMSIAGLDSTAQGLRTRVASYEAVGFTGDYAGYGYFCFPGVAGTSGPAGTANGVGSCQIRCNSGGSASATMVTGSITANGQDTAYTFNTDARCGGANMLGYRCLPAPPSATSTSENTVPPRQRLCLRECQRTADPASTRDFDSALCEFPFTTTPDAQGNPNKAFSLSGDLPPMTQLIGQTCVSQTESNIGVTTGSFRICAWNPDFTPRDPAIWPGQ
jgi:hypothetical protein